MPTALYSNVLHVCPKSVAELHSRKQLHQNSVASTINITSSNREQTVLLNKLDWTSSSQVISSGTVPGTCEPPAKGWRHPVGVVVLSGRRLEGTIGRRCHKYHFCCNKSFVTTNMRLLWQMHVCHNKTIFCHDKRNLSREKCFVATNIFCHNKTFVTTNICLDKTFVATSLLLLQQKWYLWQLPPMIGGK